MMTTWPGPSVGNIVAGTVEGEALAHGVIAALAVEDYRKAEQLAYLFDSKNDLFDAVRVEVVSFLGGGINPAHLKLTP